MEPAPTWTLTPTIPPPAERRPLDDPEMHGYPALCRRVRQLQDLLDTECQTRRLMISELETCIREQNRRIERLEEEAARLRSAQPTVSACRCGAPVPETPRPALRAWLHVED